MIFNPAAQADLRVLLIEDSKGDAMLIERALSHAMPQAFTLKKTSSLHEAIVAVEQEEFDVALLDRSLPDTEEFSGLFNLQARAPKLPILYLTAYRDEAIASGAIEQGAQDYLFKDNMSGSVIARAIHYAMLRKRFEEALITRANYDMLTGLPNRTLFASRLDMALLRLKRIGGAAAVLFLDLNGFKQVNDSCGHAVGDQLLKEVGTRLASTIRACDTTARLGGDEFLMLLENITHKNYAAMVAQKIIALFETPFVIQEQTVHVGVSIGIAIAEANTPRRGDELIRQADHAMYDAKKNPGSHFVLASESIPTPYREAI